ncbi:MAG TPA: 50S ribosomal protein L24 [Candidatus Krumholzibacteria bacterium]|nr:50S ribosomal protein L24 [Candidatus Krumholzibacteria bacterium]
MRGIVKNDTVKVISGNHKNKTGKVIMVIPEKNRVIVEKIQLVKRHTRPRSQTEPGGIIEKEASIHVSNVMLVCPKCDKPTRTRTKTMPDGRKSRVCLKCEEMISGE